MTTKRYRKLEAKEFNEDYMENGEELLEISSSETFDENNIYVNILNAYPSTWNKYQVRSWLKQKQLVGTLQRSKSLNNGHALLHLDPAEFTDYSDSEKLFREVAKL
eukprot:276680_1